ncbi:hypothetical protein E2C01_095700 [Portunus trituberculatus]|uniref:Uncharacterized protein n=1 Tax=Portunus trituberculatus TaxID=210409 RepID=A0A5B7JZI1_PORTR|nr:hypothetical protein [Portunus trituberculatus]
MLKADAWRDLAGRGGKDVFLKYMSRIGVGEDNTDGYEHLDIKIAATTTTQHHGHGESVTGTRTTLPLNVLAGPWVSSPLIPWLGPPDTLQLQDFPL